jgi:hypothetical protein
MWITSFYQLVSSVSILDSKNTGLYGVLFSHLTLKFNQEWEGVTRCVWIHILKWYIYLVAGMGTRTWVTFGHIMYQHTSGLSSPRIQNQRLASFVNRIQSISIMVTAAFRKLSCLNRIKFSFSASQPFLSSIWMMVKSFVYYLMIGILRLGCFNAHWIMALLSL